MPITHGRSAYLKEWIDGATAQKVVGDFDDDKNAETAHSGFAWNLYDQILKLFSLIVSTSGRSHDLQCRERRALKDLAGKLFLWGDSFRDGKLEKIFHEAEGLRESVLGLLTSIGDILIFKLLPSHETINEHSCREEVNQLGTSLSPLLEKAKLVLESDYESNALSDRDQFTSSDTGQAQSIMLSLKTSIECLMELLPSMENALHHISNTSPDDEPDSLMGFQVSAHVYILIIRDRFSKADPRLVERLGRANWQRHTALRKHFETQRSMTIVGKQLVPQSLVTPLPLFHDAGIGNSISTTSNYAATVVSHSSFISSAADEGSGLRVPPTPKQVCQGIPFTCGICGRVLNHIKNRIDWKRHVFADLKPYICTFPGCKDEVFAFPTRRLWQEHEFTQHRVKKIWHCSECLRELPSAALWRAHLKDNHQMVLNESQFGVASKMAEQRRPMLIGLESNSGGNSVVAQAMTLVATKAEMDPTELRDDDVLVDIGIDSLLSLVIASKLREDLDLDVPYDLLFKFSTVKALKAQIAIIAKDGAAEEADQPESEQTQDTSQQCPLCLCEPGKSNRNFATHLGKHMENIALAALPRELYADDDPDSDTDTDADAGSHAVSDAEAEVDAKKSARDHLLYQNITPQADGHYHCPWEGQDGCQHKPDKLKCNYDTFVDFHLRPYRCRVPSCGPRYAPRAKLLHHELRAHYYMHRYGDRPYLCHYEGCERGVPENEFSIRSDLRVHLMRVHNDIGSPPNLKAAGMGKQKIEKSSSPETLDQKRPYACQSCDARFARYHNLKSHMLYHLGEYLYPCPKCDDRFENEDGFASHIRGGCRGKIEPQLSDESEDGADDNISVARLLSPQGELTPALQLLKESLQQTSEYGS